MKKLLLGTAAILAGLSAGVNAGVSVSEIKHLKFYSAGNVVGRSETTGHIVRSFSNDFSSAGFEIIDGNKSFTVEQIQSKVILEQNISNRFFENYPNLPGNNGEYDYSRIGLFQDSSVIDYLDLTSRLMKSSEAILRGQSVVLASGDGYQPKGIAGDYFVFAEGSSNNRTVYRCNLQDLVSDIEVFKEACDIIISNQNDQGGAFDEGTQTRIINNSGFVLYPPSYGSSNYTLVYPNGETFPVISESSSSSLPMYISDGISPTISHNGKTFNVLPSGPVLDENRALPEEGVYLLSETQKYNYYFSAFSSEQGYPVPKFTACLKGDELSFSNDLALQVDSITEASVVEYLVSTFNDPLQKDLFRNYPELPSNEVLTAVGTPFYAGMPQTEYQNILKPNINETLQEFQAVDDRNLEFANDSINSYCSGQVHSGLYTLAGLSPFNLLSDSGIYAAPISEYSNLGYYLRSFSGGNGISLYNEVANYLLDTLSLASAHPEIGVFLKNTYF